MPPHFCKTHTEARQSNREFIEPSHKSQEHSSMKFKERIHVNEIEKETGLIIGGQFLNRWAKMKGSAPWWFDFSQVECLINLPNKVLAIVRAWLNQADETYFCDDFVKNSKYRLH